MYSPHLRRESIASSISKSLEKKMSSTGNLKNNTNLQSIKQSYSPVKME